MDDARPPERVGGLERLRQRFAALPVPPYELVMADRPAPPVLVSVDGLHPEARSATLGYGVALDPDLPTVLVVTAFGDHEIDVLGLLWFEARRWVTAPGPVEPGGRTTVVIEGIPRPATLLVQEEVTAVVPDGAGHPVVLLEGMAPTGLRLERCRDLEPYVRGQAIAGELLGRRYPDGRIPRRR